MDREHLYITAIPVVNGDYVLEAFKLRAIQCHSIFLSTLRKKKHLSLCGKTVHLSYSFATYMTRISKQKTLILTKKYYLKTLVLLKSIRVARVIQV